jgi:hypothetical protein
MTMVERAVVMLYNSAGDIQVLGMKESECRANLHAGKEFDACFVDGGTGAVKRTITDIGDMQ